LSHLTPSINNKGAKGTVIVYAQIIFTAINYVYVTVGAGSLLGLEPFLYKVHIGVHFRCNIICQRFQYLASVSLSICLFTLSQKCQRTNH